MKRFITLWLTLGIAAAIVVLIVVHRKSDWSTAVTAAASVFAAMATASAAIAAAVSAGKSADAARDSRRALALHHRPAVGFSNGDVLKELIHEPPNGVRVIFPEIGEEVAIGRLSIDAANGGVRDVRLSWTPVGGRPQTIKLTLPTDEVIPLTGVKLLSHTPGIPATNECSATYFAVTCVDNATRTLWRASASSAQGRLQLPPWHLGFEPVETLKA